MRGEGRESRARGENRESRDRSEGRSRESVYYYLVIRAASQQRTWDKIEGGREGGRDEHRATGRQEGGTVMGMITSREGTHHQG